MDRTTWMLDCTTAEEAKNGVERKTSGPHLDASGSEEEQRDGHQRKYDGDEEHAGHRQMQAVGGLLHACCGCLLTCGHMWESSHHHVGVWSSCAANGKPPCAATMAPSLYIAGADLPCLRAIAAVASLSTQTTSCYGVCDDCCMLHERSQLATEVYQHLHYGGHSCMIQSSQHV